ncbi:hypothetical protein DFH07DRAFT_576314 [Mycena maculata]|uniref:DUF4246 domain-containing protein n=1 Tax=Mycena maculata TaxID=230809 RepID=A0AAD7IS48_9AGAR|nr:hypothetical protein DFH07DRAFT_576314 [Mycena maculata]
MPAGRSPGLTCSSFSSLYVSSFKLPDPSKSGHHKILAVFLVHPTKDPIVSATDVPPQQAEWQPKPLKWPAILPTRLWSPLQELCDAPVKDQFPATLMTLREAEAYRLELL